MNVQLLQYDKDALDLLVFTKQTRLSFNATTFDEVKAWPLDRKLAELNYMLGTIESSWEFATYTFLITGVTRAFTHQLVRSRHASYAQQSQRTVDMTGFEYVATGELDQSRDVSLPSQVYDDAMFLINDRYQTLIKLGVPPQDARGVLPTNITTAITMKVDLRELSHMAALRLCTRTQGEYQRVFTRMREEVIAVHDWAEPFLRVHCARHGVCAFPHYQECPIKGSIFNPDTGGRWDGKFEEETGIGSFPVSPDTRAQIQANWVQLQRRGGFEARPKETK